MLEPNEMLEYILAHKEQEPNVEEMPEWLANFFADDDAYDTFSK